MIDWLKTTWNLQDPQILYLKNCTAIKEKLELEITECHILFTIRQLLQDLNKMLKVLQVSNSCVNIFIYGHMHTNFRSTIRKLFKGESVRIRTWRSRRKVIRQSFSMDSLANDQTYVTSARNSPTEQMTVSPGIVKRNAKNVSDLLLRTALLSPLPTQKCTSL